MRGLYCTKDTYVSHALQTVGSVEWVEKQTGVAYTTLKKHYAKWTPDSGRAELRRLAALFDADADVDPENSDVDPLAEKTEEDPMRGGGLEPAKPSENTSDSRRSTGAMGRERPRIDVPEINVWARAPVPDESMRRCGRDLPIPTACL